MSTFPLKNNCFVTSVTLLSLCKLGPDSMNMEPETLRDAFQADFGMKKMPQKLFDKLNCGYMLISTDAFTSTIEGFLTGTAIMNNLVFDETEIPFCTFKQCAWSIWEYINLLGDVQEGQPTVPFSEDICIYIREAGRLNGISVFPRWMTFAQPKKEDLPDMSGDLQLFEMYEARQADYINDLNVYVEKKQQKLKEELLELQSKGYIAQNPKEPK